MEKKGKRIKESKKIQIKKSSKLIITVRFVLLIIFLVSVSYLLYYAYQENQNQKMYDNLYKDLIVEDIFAERLKGLQKKNSDIIGWINIDVTAINYPILQTTNNDYYLTHNYKKEYSKYGSIFLDSNVDISDVNNNVIIYGHHMQGKQMFSELVKYNDKAFYKAHPIITIVTTEEERKYEIICVFKSLSFSENEIDVFRYYNTYSFQTKKDYSDYLNNCKKLQLYDTGLTAEYGEQIITLITCEYSQDNGRLVVVAKKNPL